MVRIRTAFFIVVLAVFNKVAHCQTDSVDYRHVTTINIVPQYTLVFGARVDFDYAFNKRHWLTVGREIYAGEINNWGTAYTEEARKLPREFRKLDLMRGIGSEVYYRYVFINPEGNSRWYTSVGWSLRYFSIDYFDVAWAKEERDGLLVLKQVFDDRTGNIWKSGPSLLLGYQVVSSNVVIDLYVGVGTRKSRVDSDLKRLRDYNRDPIDYAYSGDLYILGFKIGFQLMTPVQ